MNESESAHQRRSLDGAMHGPIVEATGTPRAGMAVGSARTEHGRAEARGGRNGEF
jgi:hypothetical protein